MASVITGMLSSTVGLLLNKARDKTADKLKDGDITDAKIREIIVRELDDVKTKIDGLSRTYLLSSYNFLQEGVNLLTASLDKSQEKQKAVLSETHDGGEKSTKPSDTESGILTRALALPKSMGEVKIMSDDEFIDFAKKRFEDARKEATKAFFNEALSIEDRVLAAKLRIVSELLECIERPDASIINCLPFLKTLHSLPAIREVFSVYINGGYKSIINKAERAENVKSVMMINYVLFQFALDFSSKYCSAITWPTIELGDRSFRPILDWKEISSRRSWGKELFECSNEVVLDEEINQYVCAVNSYGEIIDRAKGENINVTSRTGEVKMVKLHYPGDGGVFERYLRGLAVDCNNNVYVLIRILMYLETRTEGGVVKRNVLYVFDENYNIKQNCTLHFLDASRVDVEMAINKNNNIIITMNDDLCVNVCDKAGDLKHKFKRDTSCVCRLTTSHTSEIIIASDYDKAVYRYTEKGDLMSTIEVPKDQVIHGVAFHHVICKIMVLTCIMKKRCTYFLLCYSETGELESSTYLCKGFEGGRPKIKSHPSGPVVVVWRNRVTFV